VTKPVNVADENVVILAEAIELKAASTLAWAK